MELRGGVSLQLYLEPQSACLSSRAFVSLEAGYPYLLLPTWPHDRISFAGKLRSSLPTPKPPLLLLRTVNSKRGRKHQGRKLALGCASTVEDKQQALAANPRQSPPSHVDIITSPSNAFVKHCVKLRQSGVYRRNTQSLLVVGEIPLREIREWLTARSDSHRPMADVLLVVTGSEVPSSLHSFAERTVQVSPAVMAKVAGVESPDSLTVAGGLPLPLTFADMASQEDKETAPAGGWCPGGTHILALDGIQDPGNLGTLLRTAAAFAWDGVFLLPGCCDPFNDKALRASRGAAYRLHLATGEWRHLAAITSSRDMALYGGEPENDKTVDASAAAAVAWASGNGHVADRGLSEGEDTKPRRGNSLMDPQMEGLGGTEIGGSRASKGKSGLQEAATCRRLCLVLGSEGQGLSKIVQANCQALAIPMPGGVESLNVAVAGGILLYALKNGSNVLD